MLQRAHIKPRLNERFIRCLFRDNFSSPCKREIRIAVLRRRAMHRQLARSPGAVNPTFVNPTTIGDGPDPRRNPLSKGWGGRCSVSIETRRAVRHPFLRCIQPRGCSLASKTYRYLPSNSNHLLDNPIFLPSNFFSRALQSAYISIEMFTTKI